MRKSRENFREVILHAPQYIKMSKHIKSIELFLNLRKRAHIFIGKLGIAKVLSSFADEHGIALVNSKVRLTKYAKELYYIEQIYNKNK
jgi:hypothetical protein